MAQPSEARPQRYAPPGMWAWDFWFIQHQGTYHAFHLQAAKCLGEPRLMHGNQHVGHASSTDLLRWTYHGPAAVPILGTWNDRSIATGSCVAHDGNWWMVFTGVGSKVCGIGLAVSPDLMEWRKVGDGPVVLLGQRFEGRWKGERVEWTGLADPYVFPEPVDGWFHMVINSRVAGVPIHESGCLTTMRSRDLVTWEPHAVLAWPRWFERLETPQLWPHGGSWYLYFGGAHDAPMPEEYRNTLPAGIGSRGNYVFRSDRLEGPFEPVGQWRLELPRGEWGYIAKVLTGPDGRDVMLLTGSDQALSRPYPVTYLPDGSVRLCPPAEGP